MGVGTISGLCPVVDSGISSAEHSGPFTTVLICSVLPTKVNLSK
jgi:hypothetical protein